MMSFVLWGIKNLIIYTRLFDIKIANLLLYANKIMNILIVL